MGLQFLISASFRCWGLLNEQMTNPSQRRSARWRDANGKRPKRHLATFYRESKSSICLIDLPSVLLKPLSPSIAPPFQP